MLVVLNGHEISGLEKVVARHGDYLVVVKRGEAARVLAETEPAVGPSEWARLGGDPDAVGVRARVTGRWADERVLLRLEDGRMLEAPTAEEMKGIFDIGSEALAYLDRRGELVGWYLPEAQVGLDMREEDEAQALDE